MAFTTPNMGLKEWDLAGDFFSFTELKANWDAVDGHDHTATKGVQIPTGGLANLAVTGAKIAAATIDNSKLVASTLTDASIASPANSVYRTLWFTSFGMTPTQVGGTSYTAQANIALVANGVNVGSQPASFPVQATALAVPNKLTRFRLVLAYATNATAPATNVTVAVNPYTTGGTPNLSSTAGAAVSGSPTVLTAPAASAVTSFAGADFAPPADGIYCLTVTPSATPAVNSWIGFVVHLQYHHV